MIQTFINIEWNIIIEQTGYIAQYYYFRKNFHFQLTSTLELITKN